MIPLLRRYPKERPNHQRFFGADMGLVLTLKTTPSDYFYRKHQQSGFKVEAVRIYLKFLTVLTSTRSSSTSLAIILIHSLAVWPHD